MRVWWSVLLLWLVVGHVAIESQAQNGYKLLGEQKRWHPITIQVYGPQADEQGDPNPFLDYRFNVVITAPDGVVLIVPGFFAADGEYIGHRGQRVAGHFYAIADGDVPVSGFFSPRSASGYFAGSRGWHVDSTRRTGRDFHG